MKKKIGAILLTLALVIGLSIPMAIPVAAAIPVTVDFESTTLSTGDSVLGLGTVHDYLNIQSSQDVILVKEGVTPRAYTAGGTHNGCLDGFYGFADDADNDIDRKIEDYQFTFAPGITVNSFSVTMFDYGDYFPWGTNPRIAKLVGYDLADISVPGAVDTLSISGPIPAGDACSGISPGQYTFTISGTGIAKVKLEFVGEQSVDTGIALDNIAFTIEEASIDITKSGPECAHEGDIITYTYEVHNDGDVPLENVSVIDDLAGAASYVTGDDGNGLLDPCEHWIFTASYVVPTPQVPDVENEAEAMAEYEGYWVSDTDTWSVDIFHPEIEVDKEADTDTAAPCTTVNYSYTVTNEGDCILCDVTLVDDVVGPITLTGLTDEDGDTYLDDLAVDASATGTGSHHVDCSDPEWLTNTATASGLDTQGRQVTDDDSETVLTMAARTIGYWKTHPDQWCPLPAGSIFKPDEYPPEQAYLLAYFPGLGAEENGVNPLEMLRAQLIAAELNVVCFDSFMCYGRYSEADIYLTIRQAERLLQRIYDANGGSDNLDAYWEILSKRQQNSHRQAAQPLKDILATFNEIGDWYWE